MKRNIIGILLCLHGVTSLGQWKPGNDFYFTPAPIQQVLTKDKILFAVMSDSLYRSEDNGDNWKFIHTGTNGSPITTLFNNATSLFASTKSGLYRSMNNGDGWESVNAGLEGESISRIFNIGNTLFVSTDRLEAGTNTRSNGLYRSVNNGDGWQSIAVGINGSLITRIFYSKNMLLVNTTNGIFRSIDNGTTWIATHIGADVSTIPRLVSNNNAFFTHSINNIYRSQDNGKSWTVANVDSEEREIVSLFAEGSSVFAVTYKYDPNVDGVPTSVYRSDDNGKSWTVANAGMENNFVLDLYSIGTTLYTFAFYKDFSKTELYRSIDRGNSWTLANAGLEGAFTNLVFSSNTSHFASTSKGLYRYSSVGIWYLVTSQFITTSSVSGLIAHQEVLFVNSGNGIFRSTNNGDSWTSASAGLEGESITALMSHGTSLFALTYKIIDRTTNRTTYNLYRSSNNGNSWTPITTLPNHGSYISALISHGTSVFVNTSDGIYRSMDNGNSWTLVYTGIDGRSVNAFLSHNQVLLAGTPKGIYRSTDNGTSWKLVSIGSEEKPFIEKMFLGDNTLFITIRRNNSETNTQTYHFYRSEDEGKTWTLDNTDLKIQWLSTLIKHGNSIFVGLDQRDGLGSNGLFRSVDNGKNWILINDGLRAGIQVRTLLINKNELIAGTNKGVWRRPLTDFNLKIKSVSSPDTALAVYRAKKVHLDQSVTPSTTLQLSENPAGTQVNLFTKGVTRSSWQSQTLSSATTSFIIQLDSLQFDELGVEYYWQIVPPAGYGDTIHSPIKQVRLRFRDGLQLPNLGLGRSQQDYRLISFPIELTENRPAQVFDELGSPDPKQWRLFSYSQSKAITKPDSAWDELPNLETGKSYWLIAAGSNKPSVNSGNGTIVTANSRKPYQIRLDSGWNQIGNPYLLRLSWAKIKQASSKPALVHQLWTYSGNVGAPGEVLEPFAGGFVFADSATTLTFPVERDVSLNGARLSQERHDPASYLESNFTLGSGGDSYPMGGLGMHPQARADRDHYDEYNPPRWANYLEVQFPGKLSKDMRPLSEEQSWEFTIQTNLPQREWQLGWENYFREGTIGGRQLVLYNLSQEKVTDMLTGSSIQMKAGERLRVVYGDEAFVQQHTLPQRIVLGTAYPNPLLIGQTLTVPFSLPESSQPHQVELNVYDLQGRKLAVLAQGDYPAGHHQVGWQGQSSGGASLTTGLYLCRLSVAGKIAASATGKIIIR